jgi:O-antigen/teichoic acid export membrane protein
MNFRRSETLNVAAALVGTVVAVIIAAGGGGAWAIIGQQLVIAATASVLLWFASSWRPHLIFSRESARFLANFSGYLVGHRLLYYLHQNADRFLIGRYIGTAALGAYAVAYNVMLAPSARIAGPIQRVLAPAFSRMQDEPERIAAAWARVTRLVGMIAIPALVGVVVVAPDFVPVVLGDQWEAAVPVIQLLAWVGILQALQAVNVDILMARGRTKTMFRYMIVFCVAHVIAFIVGLNVSGTIVGIAAAYAISSTLVEPILTVLTARALGVSPWIFVKSVAGVAASAAVMAGVVLVARLAMVDAAVPAAVRLVLCTVLGAAVFGALCFWREPEIRRDLRSLLGSRLPVRRTAAAES